MIFRQRKRQKMISTYLFEPLVPEDAKHVLTDLATELVGKASGLAARLHPVLRTSVGDLVRSMNCYYSNLIEGHNTHPVDIDRALSGDYSADPGRRDLQREAIAHIEVQRLIDRGEAPSPTLSTDFILWVHREFCSRLPDDLLWVDNPDTGERVPVVPGEFRRVHVQVGRHIPPGGDQIAPFLARLVDAYAPGRLSKIQRITAVAASHHRLLWVHPFLDGNGRVTRLLSHAHFRELGVGSELWSISRGLARQVDRYKAKLMGADEPRRGDLDGRGNLTLAGLEAFCAFFLEISLDQVAFMEGLLDLDGLLRRMEIWCEEEIRAKTLHRGSWSLLREAVVMGEFPRGRAGSITGYEERQSRTVLTQLLARGLLVSDAPRAAVRLGFPIDVVERWFPKLYPGL